MPYFIHRSEIPKTLREPRERLYRKQLRRALQNPTLTPEDRADLEAKLAKLDRSLVAPPVPSVEPEDLPTDETEALSQESHDDLPEGEALFRLLKADIIEIGETEGAPIKSSLTKQELVDAIMAHRVSDRD
jgi:hypothetical protein